MAGTHTSTSIEAIPGGLRISMPLPRIGCVTAFLVAWLVLWSVGELAALAALFAVRPAPSPIFAFLLIWSIAWTVAGISTSWALLMSLDGREIVTIADGAIRRRAQAFFLGLSWRYPLERCRNLRPTEGASGENEFVSFDYDAHKGEQTVRFGSGLTESAAEEIAERVWELFPDLMPDRERRIREHQEIQLEESPPPES